MDAVDRRIDALESERQSTLRMAKAMRGVIEETADLKKSTKQLSLDSNLEIRKLMKSKPREIKSTLILFFQYI